MKSDTEKDTGHLYDSLYHRKFQTDIKSVTLLHPNIGKLLDTRHSASLKSSQYITNYSISVFSSW